MPGTSPPPTRAGPPAAPRAAAEPAAHSGAANCRSPRRSPARPGCRPRSRHCCCCCCCCCCPNSVRSRSPRGIRGPPDAVAVEPPRAVTGARRVRQLRRSVTLFSVSTRQKLRLLFRLSQRIVPRAAEAGGAIGTAMATMISVAAARVGISSPPEVGKSAGYLTGNARNPVAYAARPHAPSRPGSRRIEIGSRAESGRAGAPVRRHVVGPDAADREDQRIARQDGAPGLERARRQRLSRKHLQAVGTRGERANASVGVASRECRPSPVPSLRGSPQRPHAASPRPFRRRRARAQRPPPRARCRRPPGIGRRTRSPAAGSTRTVAAN